MGLVSPLIALYERPVPDNLTDEQAQAMARDEIAMEQALLAAGAPIRGQTPRPAQALPGYWALLGAITHECFNRLDEEYSTPGEQAQRFETWMAHVPPEHRERIFEKFHRVDEALTAEKSGAGLGLSIARQLARGLGGELRYAPRAGAGAEFILELP